MKKLALAALAAVLPLAALANSAPATAPATPAAAPSAMAPAAAPVMEKKVELKDGSWAKIADKKVEVSKDGGKTWTPAPDGTWEAKDGTKITTKGGMEM